MKKIFILIFLVCTLQNCFSQTPIDKLIEAEKSFAATSVNLSTKEAFLKYLDSNGVVFSNGQAINGIETWSKREKRPGILNWRPLFAEIAFSGDFGYTTGPWTYQAKTLEDSIIARGQYTTVWHKDKNGNWKFLVDLGSENTPVNLSGELKKIKTTKLSSELSDSSSLLYAEEAFINLQDQNRKAAYKKFLSAESILNRNGILPVTNLNDQIQVLELMLPVAYKIGNWGISSTKDLGYVYGNSVVNNKTENYLRIWRREKGGWKIAVEVLRY